MLGMNRSLPRCRSKKRLKLLNELDRWEYEEINRAQCVAVHSGTPRSSRYTQQQIRVRQAITVGDNVWIGGSVTIVPGVRIGNDVVIGAGSVVTSDIPNGVVAAGNPCKVIKQITEADKRYAYKKEKIDDEVWDIIVNGL